MLAADTTRLAGCHKPGITAGWLKEEPHPLQIILLESILEIHFNYNIVL
jgi:hypothetical protein